MVEIHVQSSLSFYGQTHELWQLNLNKYVYERNGHLNGLSVLFNEDVIWSLKTP
jgi:hypothetical protein